MKKIITLTLLCMAYIMSSAGSFVAYTPGNIFEIKNNKCMTWGKFEYYDSDLQPDHIRAFRFLTTCGNDIMPDEKLTLTFIDDTTYELEPLPGQMWRRVQMTLLGNLSSVLITSMCYNMTDEIIRKISSTPLKQIDLYTAKKNKKTKENKTLESFKIKDKNGLNLQTICQQELHRLGEIQSENIRQSTSKVTADFYSDF